MSRPRLTHEHLADQTVIITLHYMTTTPDPNHVRCVMASPGMGMAEMPANTEADKRSIEEAIEYRAEQYRRQGYRVDRLTLNSEGVDWSP